MSRAPVCPRMLNSVCRNMPPRMGRAIRLAGGLRGCNSSLGPPRPITMASRVTRNRSKNRNCQSPRLVFTYIKRTGKHIALVRQAMEIPRSHNGLTRNRCEGKIGEL